MLVARFCFEHSPILGQAASSQTVTRPWARMSLRVSWYSRETGALTRIQSGFRWIGLSGLCAFSGWRGCSEVMMTRQEPAQPGVLRQAQDEVRLLPR